jgi:hypothetical protein
MRVSRHFAYSRDLPILLIAALTITEPRNEYPSWALTPFMKCAYKDPHSLQGRLGFSAETILPLLAGNTADYTSEVSDGAFSRPKELKTGDADYLLLSPFMAMACERTNYISSCVHCGVCCAIEKEIRSGNMAEIRKPDAYCLVADTMVLFALRFKVQSRANR